MSRNGVKTPLPAGAGALAGRSEPMAVSSRHHVSGHPLAPPFPPGISLALFALGCFWGAEKRFWEMEGVYSTAVGYAGGVTPNPTYAEVCSGLTGHAEVVRVAFDRRAVPYEGLLKMFWESHDPTQGMRQGNDAGPQYRSAIFAYDAQQRARAEDSRRRYQTALRAAGLGAITTEIHEAPIFYFAEARHQQYLAKNPYGYCGLGDTGVAFPGAFADGSESQSPP